MKKRHFEVTAVMVDLDDRRFDKTGMGSLYSSLILAKDKVHAEAQLRKDKRFRKHCRAQGAEWRDVLVLVDRCSVEDFTASVGQGAQRVVQTSMRRDRFMKRISA